MKVKLINSRVGFIPGKAYKVINKTRSTYLLRNEKGYVQSIKSKDCEVISWFKQLFR